LETCIAVIDAFLADKSGGERGMAVAGALFEAIGLHFKLFTKVERFKVNVADTSTGQSADLHCKTDQNELVFVVEVKERALTLEDLGDTITKARRDDLREIFFTAPKVKATDETEILKRVDSAFKAGQNLYVFTLQDIARPVLALGGES